MKRKTFEGQSNNDNLFKRRKLDKSLYCEMMTKNIDIFPLWSILLSNRISILNLDNRENYCRQSSLDLLDSDINILALLSVDKRTTEIICNVLITHFNYQAILPWCFHKKSYALLSYLKTHVFEPKIAALSPQHHHIVGSACHWNNCLKHACRNGFVRGIQFLLYDEYIKNITKHVSFDLAAAVHLAASFKHIDIVKLLLQDFSNNNNPLLFNDSNNNNRFIDLSQKMNDNITTLGEILISLMSSCKAKDMVQWLLTFPVLSYSIINGCLFLAAINAGEHGITLMQSLLKDKRIMHIVTDQRCVKKFDTLQTSRQRHQQQFGTKNFFSSQLLCRQLIGLVQNIRKKHKHIIKMDDFEISYDNNISHSETKYKEMQQDIVMFKLLFKNSKLIHPHLYKSKLLRKVCEYNLVPIMNILIGTGKMNHKYISSVLLGIACNLGYYNMVKLLLSVDKVDPTYSKMKHIRSCFQQGYYQIVMLLLNHPYTINAHPGVDELCETLFLACCADYKKFQLLLFLLESNRIILSKTNVLAALINFLCRYRFDIVYVHKKAIINAMLNNFSTTFYQEYYTLQANTTTSQNNNITHNNGDNNNNDNHNDNHDENKLDLEEKQIQNNMQRNDKTVMYLNNTQTTLPIMLCVNVIRQFIKFNQVDLVNLILAHEITIQWTCYTVLCKNNNANQSTLNFECGSLFKHVLRSAFEFNANICIFYQLFLISQNHLLNRPNCESMKEFMQNMFVKSCKLGNKVIAGCFLEHLYPYVICPCRDDYKALNKAIVYNRKAIVSLLLKYPCKTKYNNNKFIISQDMLKIAKNRNYKKIYQMLFKQYHTQSNNDP